MVEDGNGFTVRVMLCVLVQPEELVPVTMYVTVLPGLAVTLAPVVALNPVAGDHAYVLAPETFRVVVFPAQMVFVPEIVSVGNGFTVMV